MISQMLTNAIAIEALKERKFSDTAAINYRNNLLNYKKSLLNKGKEPEPIFVKDALGYGDLTLAQYKALPREDRRYLSQVLAARKMGKTPLTRKEFNALGKKTKIPTTAMGAAIESYVNKTGDLPPESKLKEWVKIYNPPLVTIENAVTKAEKISKVKARATVTSPGFLAKIVKEVNDDVNLDIYGFGTPIYNEHVKMEVLKRLDYAIKNAYIGHTVSRQKEGWYVDGKLVRRNPYAE